MLELFVNLITYGGTSAGPLPYDRKKLQAAAVSGLCFRAR
jgi:hypothetical protein